MTIALLMLAVTASAALFQYLGARAICRWSPPLSLLSAHEEIVAAARRGPTAIELSVILPCRNAGRAVREFLGKLIEQLGVVDGFEVIVVSDGSTDDTVEIAREFASPAVRVFHYPRGSGKGHALRVGLSKARGQYIGYIDSDGDIDPQAIGPFISLMNLYGLDIVLGSKRHPMSEVDYPILRRAMSWVYHKVARILFMVPVRDTQTGFKVIRREVLDAVLPRMLEKRYAFDLELLVVARLLGYKKVFEAPVRITYQFSSQVVPATALRILIDTLAIFYRRYILNTYRYAGDRLVVDVEGADERDRLIQEM
jgi:glycosyltransferase involved in cell wall biosynthesis